MINYNNISCNKKKKLMISILYSKIINMKFINYKLIQNCWKNLGKLNIWKNKENCQIFSYKYRNSWKTLVLQAK